MYASPIIKVIKSMRMRCVGHVVHMEETSNAYKILVRKPEGKTPLIRLGIARKIILEWILVK
jgi:hypothetical protein